MGLILLCQTKKYCFSYIVWLLAKSKLGFKIINGKGMKKLTEMPMPPFLGIGGHLKVFGNPDLHLQLFDWKKAYGELYRLRFGFSNIIVISKRKIIQELLEARPERFRRTTQLERIFSESKFNGVFSSNGETWQKQRRFVEDAFKTDNIKTFYPKLKIITSRLIAHFNELADSNKTVDLLAELKRYTADVTIWLAFGEDFNSLENGESDFEKQINIIFLGIYRRLNAVFPYWYFYKTAKEKKYADAHKKIGKMIHQFIILQRKKMSICPELINEPENLLQAMLAEQINSKAISDEEIFANCVTILSAGVDTTANTIAWMSLFISEYSEIQNSLIQEISATTDDGLYDWPLPKMPLLNAIMYESMRLKPVAPILVLENLDHEIISGYKVKRGSKIILLLTGCGLNEDCFKNYQQFDPQRWLQQTEQASFANMRPFGGGKRVCPGRWLAMLEMKLVIAAMFKNFTLEPQQKASQVQEELAFTMSPKGFFCKVHKK